MALLAIALGERTSLHLQCILTTYLEKVPSAY
jgi:hypothetical protein